MAAAKRAKKTADAGAGGPRTGGDGRVDPADEELAGSWPSGRRRRACR